MTDRLEYPQLDLGAKEAATAVLADLARKVDELPQPTLGLAGGVSRAAVLALIREEIELFDGYADWRFRRRG